MSEFTIRQFEPKDEETWEKIVKDSRNGTILHTRKFLNYHKEGKFIDNSLIFNKGNNFPIAVMPANVVYENGKKILYSHQGSTFGGIVLLKDFFTLTNVKGLIESLDSYLKENKFDKVTLKWTGDCFCKGNNDLFYYLLFLNHYQSYDELSFCIDLKNTDDLIANMDGKSRNQYKKSLSNGLVMKKIFDNKDIKRFHELLCVSLQKYNVQPVHSYEDLLLLRDNNLKDNIEFYGVFKDEIMVSGAMIFLFDGVFHTQYLPGDPEYLKLYTLDFMDMSLILEAKKRGFKYFSFGISTEDHGSYLNESLAKFKEGFGSNFYINKTFYKEVK